MSDVPVVWLQEAAPERESAARALSDWARTRGIVLSEPRAASRSIAIDETIPAEVEKELGKAREAIAGADGDAADRALARADALLRAHPESPAAPWLRAETWRLWSVRFRPVDAARADAAWQEAEALDGGRVAGIGEKAVPPPAKVALRIVGDATVDGHSPGSGDVLPGEHVVVAKRDGQIVYAEWIAVRGPMTIEIPRSIDSCSLQSFAGVKRAADGVTAPGVTCPEWIAAVPAERGVLVARCGGDACSSLIEWRRGEATMLMPQSSNHARTAWPAWATWTLVGAGAAAVTTVALIAAGAFESRPVESRFVVGGVKTAGRCPLPFCQ